MEEAQGTKAPVQRLADRISGVFVPFVLALALATFAGWSLVGGDASAGLVTAVTVLIIACPCARSAWPRPPPSWWAWGGRGHGRLIKDGEVLEPKRVDTVVFDRTGTLTKGEMSLTDVVPADGEDPDVVLGRAAAVEATSEHPVGRAVVEGARERLDAHPTADDFTSVTGRGVAGERGRCGGTRRPRQADERGRPHGLHRPRREAQRLEGEGKTAIFVGWEGRVRGLLAVADTMKDDAPGA